MAAMIKGAVALKGGLTTPASSAWTYDRWRIEDAMPTPTPKQTMEDPSQGERFPSRFAPGILKSSDSRIERPKRAIRNPKPMREIEVRTQARNVRSAAR
jgi:hypothetical protein